MTDIATGETPELVSPVPPEISAEVPDLSSPNSGSANAELEAAAQEGDAPALPFDVEHLGVLRRAVLDHLLDTQEQGPQSVAAILASMPAGTTRGSAESAIKREFDAGRITRTSPGHYTLAPVKPVEPVKAPPPPPEEEAIWFDALEHWVVDRASWDTERFGPSPDQPNHQIPRDIAMRFTDRLRKRRERQRERDAAAAQQAAADRELRDKLIAATHGNFVAGPGLDDVAPIRAAMELVPLDVILGGITYKCDRKLYPPNQPAVSWREERLLKSIAERYSRYVLVPSMVDAWSKAGQAQAHKAHESSPSAASPVVTDKPMPAPANAEASKAPAAVQTPPETDDPPGDVVEASPDTKPRTTDSVGLNISPMEPVPDADGMTSEAAPAPVAVGRDQVLAAFNRSCTPPSPSRRRRRNLDRQSARPSRSISAGSIGTMF